MDEHWKCGLGSVGMWSLCRSGPSSAVDKKGGSTVQQAEVVLVLRWIKREVLLYNRQKWS